MASFLKVGGSWIPMAVIYVKENGTWVKRSQAELETYVSGKTLTFGEYDFGEHTLLINSIPSVTGETYSFSALYDNRTDVTTACTWTMVSGLMYAVLSSAGTLSILSNANDSSVTVRAEYGDLTVDKSIRVTYAQGVTADTETQVVTDESGNTTTTTTTTIENEDGSSQVETTTVITDESGNTVGTQESTQNNNADGSYDSTSTTYDENGNPTETTNASGDTEGNVSTQGIEYDESGTSAVTAYTIDTSGNPDGEKRYNGDGVNTEYYAFDVTRGFVMHIHFYINFTQQPAGQDENHHNIVTAKRATPSPWYGFQLRQTSTNKYIQLGTQFSGGSNVNTTIASAATASANTAEYDLTITYNPTASSNRFVCRNNLTSSNVYTSNNKFPDIDDLKYIKVTVGCAMDANGDPFRYSNIEVLDFSITRI